VLRRFLVGLAVSVFTVGATSTPAEAITNPGGGGGCAAWVVTIKKPTPSTIRVNVKVACEEYHSGAWRISPLISRNSDGKFVEPTIQCGSTVSHPLSGPRHC